MISLNFLVSVFSVVVFGIFGKKYGYERLLLLLPILLPTAVIKVNLGIEFNLLELLVYECAFFFTLAKIKSDFNGKKEAHSLEKKEYLILIALFFLATVISVINAYQQTGLVSNFMASLQFWKSVILPAFLYWYMLNFSKKSNFKKRIFLDGMVVSALVLSMIGLLEYYLSGSAKRISVFTTTFDTLPLFLSPLLTYVLIVIEQSEIKKSILERVAIASKKVFKFSRSEFPTYFYWFSLIILVITLLIFKSYTSWFAVFLGFFFYYIFKDRKFSLEKMIALFAGVVLISGLFSSSLSVSSQSGSIKFNAQTLNPVRFEVWDVSAQLLKEYVMFGLGLNRFSDIYVEKADQILFRTPISKTISDPFNMLLEVWLNLGMLGMISFVALIWLAFRRALLLKTELLNASFFGVTMLVSFLVNGLFYGGFFQMELLFQFLTIVTVIWIED